MSVGKRPPFDDHAADECGRLRAQLARQGTPRPSSSPSATRCSRRCWPGWSRDGLEHLILRLDGNLIGLYDRRERGDKVDLPIHNKEEQKRGYEEALVVLQRTVAQERSLTMGMPRFVGAVRVEVRYLVPVEEITRIVPALMPPVA